MRDGAVRTAQQTRLEPAPPSFSLLLTQTKSRAELRRLLGSADRPDQWKTNMRAAVLTEINKPLQILDLEQEPPKPKEVRVRVRAAGVCISDWHIMNGDWPLPLPMVLGHEAAGIVIEQ